MNKQAALASMRKGMFQVFGGLLMEHKDGTWAISMGRVAFWVTFGHCLYVWNQLKETAQGELYTLMALLTYAGVKLGTDALKTIKGPANAD